MTESLWSDCIWKESQIEDVCVSFVSSMEQLIEVMKDWRSGQSSRHNSAVSRRIWRFEAIPYQLHEDLTKISFDDSVNV